MRISDMSGGERAILARRVGLNTDCDDATLAAFVAAELKSTRAERNLAKQQAIHAAAQRERKRRGLSVAPTAQPLDATGSYPRSWLAPRPVQKGRITHGGGGCVTVGA